MLLPACALIRIVTDAAQQHDYVNWSLSHVTCKSYLFKEHHRNTWIKT